MTKYEQDLLFNRGDWRRIIESQHRFFDIEALIEISDDLRDVFHNGTPAGREMPVIGSEHWKTQVLVPYVGGKMGYDLPCLISADRPARGRIMLCAQDPLRRDPSEAPQVATFFGTENEKYRYSRRHYGALWSLVRTCVHAGYDVLLTDAFKVFVGKGRVMKDPALFALCKETLRDEIAAFAPDKILALGGEARTALWRLNLGLNVIPSYHPSARGKWWVTEHQGAPTKMAQGIELYYLRRLFNADAPPA